LLLTFGGQLFAQSSGTGSKPGMTMKSSIAEMKMKKWLLGWWCPIVMSLQMTNHLQKRHKKITKALNIINIKKTVAVASSGCQCEDETVKTKLKLRNYQASSGFNFSLLIAFFSLFFGSS
jgi:hypothetical protein